MTTCDCHCRPKRAETRSTCTFSLSLTWLDSHLSWNPDEHRQLIHSSSIAVMSFYPGQGFNGSAPQQTNGYPPQSYSPVPPRPGYPPQQGYGPPGPAHGGGYGAPPQQMAPYGYNNPPPQPQAGYGYGPPQQPNGYPGPRPGMPTINSNSYVHGNSNAPRPPPTTPQAFGNGAPGAYSEPPPIFTFG